MPVAGLEYRYPMINVQSWGTNIVEPIAQVIARPNESKSESSRTRMRRASYSTTATCSGSTSSLAGIASKAAAALNYGVQTTTQFNQGGYFNILFGQSYQLFGLNSFAAGDATNTGLNSGLDTRLSDYVARVAYQPDRIFTFTTRYRFGQENFDMQRFELEGKANFDRLSLQALYGNYAAQPELGFLKRREGILGGVSYKVTQNWAVLAAARYDLDAEKFDQTRLGVGYIDDCLILALNYITSYTYSGNPTKDHRLMLQLSLRTLGTTRDSTGLPASAGYNRGRCLMRRCDEATVGRIDDAGLQSEYPRNLRAHPARRGGRRVAVMILSPAQAQIVLYVTGQPITAYDIEQRGKLIALVGRRQSQVAAGSDRRVDRRQAENPGSQALQFRIVAGRHRQHLRQYGAQRGRIVRSSSARCSKAAASTQTP